MLKTRLSKEQDLMLLIDLHQNKCTVLKMRNRKMHIFTQTTFINKETHKAKLTLMH